MPAIHGVYTIHPKTKTKGIWVHSCIGNSPVLGLSQTDIDNYSSLQTNEQLATTIKNSIESNLSIDPEFIITVLIDKTQIEKITKLVVVEGSSRVYKI